MNGIRMASLDDVTAMKFDTNTHTTVNRFFHNLKTSLPPTMRLIPSV